MLARSEFIFTADTMDLSETFPLCFLNLLQICQYPYSHSYDFAMHVISFVIDPDFADIYFNRHFVFVFISR